jgi:type II secretory ATPase GspE/PulE/Tfp pilus assembly ATPase PilB-like protein
MLTLIMAAAIKARSSDIHIEAEERGVKVRFRIDGILHDVAELDKKMWPQVVARVKLVAKLKIISKTARRMVDLRFFLLMTKSMSGFRLYRLLTVKAW